MTDTVTTIRKRSDFLAANSGMRVARPGFILLAKPNGAPGGGPDGGKGKRLGITVTKKIGNAVVRNRMKRRFREIARSLLPDEGLPDHDHILIGRAGGVERDFEALRCDLAAALVRLQQGRADPPRRRQHKPRSRRA